MASLVDVRSEQTALTLSKNLLLLILLLLIGTALRLYELGAESFWQDEVTMAVITSDTAQFIEQITFERAPVFTALGYIWVSLFGVSETAVRTLPMLLGVLSIAILYLVGRELFDARVGLIAAFFMTFAGQHIYHSQNYRYYAAMVLFTLLSFLFLARALRSNRWRDFGLYILFSALLFYTHLHGVFILMAQGFLFILEWFNRRWLPSTRLKWLVSLILIALIVSPFVIYRVADRVVSSEGLGLDWLTAPELTAPLDYVIGFLFYGKELVSIVLSLVVLVVGLAIYIVRQGFPNWRRNLEQTASQVRDYLRAHRHELAVLLVWFVIPIAAPFILSFVITPMFTSRYIITASPALYLLIAVALVNTRRLIPTALLLATYLIAAMPGFYNSYYIGVSKEQWRESAAYVEQMEAEGDVIVIPTFDRPEGFTEVDAFDWYYGGQLPICQMVYERINEPEVAQAFSQCVSGHDRIWLVLFDHPNFPAQIEDLRAYFAASQLAQAEATGFQFISVYRFEPSS